LTKQLSQTELSAANLISALIEIASINTDPKYGFGTDTLELVRNHVRGWHRDTRSKIFEAIDRIFR